MEPDCFWLRPPVIQETGFWGIQSEHCDSRVNYTSEVRAGARHYSLILTLRWCAHKRTIYEPSATNETKSSFSQDVPSVRTQSGPSRSEVSDESDNCTMEVEEEGNTTTRTSDISKSEKEDKKSKPGPQTTKPEPAESAGSNSGSASAPAPSKPRLRAPCPYGKDCYRYLYLFKSCQGDFTLM